MDSRYIDFDAARAEQTQEPLLLHAYGETFELPGTMSAALFLDILRMEQDRGADSEVTFSEAVALLRRVLPEDVLAALVERPDFSLNDMIELTGMVIKAYATGVGPQQGEAKAPSRTRRPK